MRWLLGSLGLLAWVALGVACNTVDASECWVNTSGGFGGGGTIPIGAAVGATSGDFPAVPPSGPLDYGDVPNPCIAPQDSCNEKCEAQYDEAAAACSKEQIEAQRKACQDGAYTAYKNCRADCLSKTCTDMFDACQDIGGGCTKGYPGCDKYGQSSCGTCFKACKSGASYPPACRCHECGFE
ncbi:MAG: hypothetical protein QM820_14455 [Minicystis sp.]